MSTPARKIEIRKANEALILETAERVFALSGYQGASIAHIAREAGLPKANVHYYFKTKLDLYRQVLEQILDDWMEEASTFEKYPGPEQALRHLDEAVAEMNEHDIVSVFRDTVVEGDRANLAGVGML